MGTPGETFSVAQLADGTLAFGRNGISTFDGERWRSWSMNNSFAVRGLDVGPDGRIWAGGHGEIGWFEKRDGQFVYTSLVERLPEEHRSLPELWNAFADGDGAVFIEDTRIFRWDGNEFQIWSLPVKERLRAFRIDGRIFIHQQASGLHVLDAMGPRLIIPASILGPGRVWWLRPEADGYRILNRHGFASFRGGVLVQDVSETSAAIDRGFPGYVLELPDGRLAISTVHGGVILAARDGTTHISIDRAAGLPTESADYLGVDRDNTLWITARSYVASYQLAGSQHIFDGRAQLPPTPVLNLALHNGRLIASTENELLAKDPAGEGFTRLRNENLPAKVLLPTPAGVLSGGFESLALTAAGTTTIVRRPPSALGIVASRSRPGDYILLENHTLLRMSSDLRTTEFVCQLPIPLSQLAEDIEGNIWLGTAKGLLMVEASARQPAKATAPAPGWNIPAITSRVRLTQDASDAVFVFSREGAWRKAAGASSFAPIENFPPRSIAAVTASHSNPEVWVVLGSEPGLAPLVGRIAISGSQARWVAHDVEALADVTAPGAILAEIISSDRRNVWIGGSNGIVRAAVDVGAALAVPRAPLVAAFARASGDAPEKLITDDLSYSTHSIRVELAAPEFHRRALLRIETFIEGIDSVWVPAGRDSERELTGLRDGTFTIKARVVANTGTVSPESSFTFTVLPPWWRTTPAAAGLVVIMALLAFGAVRLRERALVARNAHLETKVRQRTEELEAANAAKTAFVANMSHDIRNPLNGIVGLTLALDQTRLDPRQREIVSTLRECTGYLSTLVDDVLDFASIEAGRVELRPGPYMPGELLRSIVTTVKTDAAACGATLTCEADPALPTHLLGDAGRIQQILINFVSNALKYAGGHIHLSVLAPAGAPDEIEFAVADEGAGISASEQATLFTKFTRLKRTRDSNIPGAGLGLAACRLLADIMGGSVGVHSQPGRGARFHLRLPLTLASAAPTPELDHLPNTTVLLVEDTDYNAWAATAVLARLGLACDRARDGAEALRMYSENHYNVVLLDRNLPDMDGTDIARRIREMDANGAQPLLLAVTAYCTAEDRALCIEAGMDAFVGKPLTPEKLRKVLLEARGLLVAAPPVEAPRDPAAPAFDFSLLGYLSDGTSEGLAAQLQTFCDTLACTERELAESLAAPDFTAAMAHAHRIVGQARMIAATALAQAALDLEGAARARDQQACAQRLARVTAEIAALTAAMTRHRRSMSTA